MSFLGNYEDGSSSYPIHYYPQGPYGPYLQCNNKNYTIPSFYYDKSQIDLKSACKIIKNRDEWLAKKAESKRCNDSICDEKISQ